MVEHSEKSTQSQEYESSSSQLIYVHIAGEVSNPGMYELKHDARVSDAIDAAGGLTENADQLSINLARPALLIADSLHHRILRFCRAR